jgi:hypothetical protein
VYDEDNVIVSGFGWALAHLYGKVGSETITDYQIDRFKLGVSGNGRSFRLVVRRIFLAPISSLNDYVGTGDSNLNVVSGYRWANDTATTTGEWFAKIPLQQSH